MIRWLCLRIAVLPSKKPPRNNERVEELFCVKEGEGLKIKLQRKVSSSRANNLSGDV